MHNYANHPPPPITTRYCIYIYVNKRAGTKLELRILWGIGKLNSIQLYATYRSIHRTIQRIGNRLDCI